MLIGDLLTLFIVITQPRIQPEYFITHLILMVFIMFLTLGLMALSELVGYIMAGEA